MDSKWKVFVEYQNGDNLDYPSFDTALTEIIIAKRILSHWISYIIPINKPSLEFKNTFVVNKHDIDDYLEVSSLRNNYMLIMISIFQQLEEIDNCYYNDFIPFDDLKKIYKSAKMFRRTQKYLCVQKVCQDVMNLLEEYIYEREQKHRRFQNMLLSCVRKAE